MCLNSLNPKEVRIAQDAGFCFGVAKAVATAQRELSQRGESPLVMYGALIHNRQVIDELLDGGMVLCESPEEVPEGAKVLLRAHGIPEQEKEALLAKNCSLIDGTCAYVSRVQRFARAAAEEGEGLIITGDPNHAEVRGIVSHYEPLAGRKAIIIQSVAEAEDFEPRGGAWRLISQTTFSTQLFGEISEIFKKKIIKFKIFDTICNATEIRQSEARSLAEACDLMIVIGGKHSSNTRKLTDVCAQFCGETYQVENCDAVRKLKAEGLLRNKVVGITAGASTPQSIISEVFQVMTEFNEVQGETQERVEGQVEETAQVTETVEVADASVEGQIAPELMDESAKSQVAEGEKTQEASVEDESQTSLRHESHDVSFTDFIDNIPHIKRGETIEGVIVRYDSDYVYVDVRDKSEGRIPRHEFDHDPDFDLDQAIAERRSIEVYVRNIRNGSDGKEIQLSKQHVDQIKNRKLIEEAFEKKEPLTVKVISVVKDGVIASYGGCEIYIHRTQLETTRVDDLQPYVGQTLDVLITQFDLSRRRPRISGSRRALLTALRRKQANEVWDNLEVGDIYEGVVRNTTPFGAFVDIGGVDGLVHISELSWNHIRDPKEVVQNGDKIQVYVKEFDREKRRISLGYKKIEDDPYYNIEGRFPVGSVVKGKVVRLRDFGAFIEIAPGVDALCHISQISTMRLNKPGEVLKEGMEVEARVLEVSSDPRRISVSIRDVMPMDELLDPVAAAKRKQETEFPTSYREDSGSGADIQITHVNKKEDEEA